MHESNFLKDDIQNIRQLLAIPCLKHFMISDLTSLVRLSRVRHYACGECIICEGEKDPWVYFLLAGRVNVVKNGVTVGTVETMGELFGEMRILDGQARSASVIADAKVICLALDTSASHRLRSVDEIKNVVKLFYEIFSKILSARLRRANEEIVRLTEELKRLRTLNRPGKPLKRAHPRVIR